MDGTKRNWRQAAVKMRARTRRFFRIGHGRRWGSSVPYSVDIDSLRGTDIADSEVGRLFLSHSGRLVHKWAQYFPAYSSQLAPFRAGFPLPGGGIRPLRFMEIGVSHGGSLQLWREYFGRDALICGIDVNPLCAQFDDSTAMVRIGSQTDPDFLRAVVAEMGGVDIVLDDGSHVASHQRASFDVLFPLVCDGGVYAVEDLHTSYWVNFKGGIHRRGTFIEVVKDMLDDMHDWYHDKPRRVLPMGTGVGCVAVFDSLVFVHKQSRLKPMSVRIGTASF